jgi:hypothetical protein
VILDPITPEEIAEAASLNLYDYALRLRMGRNGGADPNDPAWEIAVIDALVARVSTWRKPRPGCERADAAIRMFVVAVLDECGVDCGLDLDNPNDWPVRS